MGSIGWEEQYPLKAVTVVAIVLAALAVAVRCPGQGTRELRKATG